MSGNVDNDSTSNCWDRVVGCYNSACVWGSSLVSGASSAYYISRSTRAIAEAINSLPRLAPFDPLVFTLGVPSLFGLIGTIMIPAHLYSFCSDLFNGESWRTRGVILLRDLGNLGMALGATAQTVVFLWAEARPHLTWLPVFQLVSATIAGSDVVLSGIHLHRLKRLDQYLSQIKELPDFSEEPHKKIFTQESAEKYLGVPQLRFEEFKEALSKEPDQGLEALRARVKVKLVEQRLKIAAGVISVLALAVLTGIALAPTPIAPVALIALTIVAYLFSGTSSVLRIAAIYKNAPLLSDPSFGCKCPAGGAA